jgi:hypothetical protein
MKEKLQSFLTSKLYPQEKISPLPLTGSWVSLKAGLDIVEKRKFQPLLGTDQITQLVAH